MFFSFSPFNEQMHKKYMIINNAKKTENSYSLDKILSHLDTNKLNFQS